MEPITTQATEKVFQHSKKALGIFTLTLLLITSFLFLNQNAEAQQLVCPERTIVQVTNDPVEKSQRPSVNGGGTLVAFESESNINGGNPGNIDQIYIYNVLTQVITQLTFGDSGSISAAISADGSRVAFESRANFNGGNPDGSREVYLFDIATLVLTQITSSPQPIRSRAPSVNRNGNLVAFHSDGDFTGQNPDGNTEIFLFNAATATITQITDTMTDDNFSPAISADSSRISFESSANINGGNPGGIEQLYYFDIATGTFTQVTFNASGDVSNSSISADGSRIAFQSSGNINGLNPSNTTNIFIYDVPSNTFSNVSNQTSGFNQTASISGNGLRVGFRSTSNINGGNPGGVAQVFLFDTVSGQTIQITDGSKASERPSLNGDGTIVAFESDANINGGNPDGEDEIFIATCLDPATARNIPTLSEWGLIAMAGVLGIIGLLAIRRRKIVS